MNMKPTPFTGVGALLFGLTVAHLAYGQEKSMIAYKPDIVGVDRMFVVAIEAPKDTPKIGVTVPDCTPHGQVAATVAVVWPGVPGFGKKNANAEACPWRPA